MPKGGLGRTPMYVLRKRSRLADSAGDGGRCALNVVCWGRKVSEAEMMARGLCSVMARLLGPGDRPGCFSCQRIRITTKDYLKYLEVGTLVQQEGRLLGVCWAGSTARVRGEGQVSI